MNRLLSAALIAALSTTSVVAAAQTPVAQPAATSNSPAAVPLVLAAGTQIVVANNSEITSTEHRVGHVFPLTVTQDVRVGDSVVIPRGTRAMAEITWRTGRGAFGKSGKINFSIRYLDMNGTRVPVIGNFRQEGEGNTLATVGVVVLAGLIGGALVTGSRARVPAGREFNVTLADATPFVHAANGLQLDPSFRPRPVEEVAAAERARVRQEAETGCRATAEQQSRRESQRAQQTRRCVTQAMRHYTA